MNIRHARAIAVFGIVLITLTGARGSGGGGCKSDSDNGSSSSSSSSSGGSIGSTTGGTVKHDPMRDVTIDKCGMAESGKLAANVTVRNPDAKAYSYLVTVEFKGDLGDVDVPSEFASVTTQVGANATVAAEASARYTGTDQGREYKKCELTSVTRTPV
ncbi:hypothetical protein ACWEFL_15160 [Streptomyces sp. NPDC004838]